MEIAWLGFIHLSATSVAEIAESTNLKGVSTYFCIYSVYHEKNIISIIEAVNNGVKDNGKTYST
jgi:hypothetical protein